MLSSPPHLNSYVSIAAKNIHYASSPYVFAPCYA